MDTRVMTKKEKLIEDIFKKCSKCQTDKNICEFNLHSKKKGIPKPYCKSCQKTYDKYYSNTRLGLVTQLYKSLKSSSKTRGHPTVNFTKEDFYIWLLSNDYENLYKIWETNDFERKLKPSVDRLDDTCHYYFNNMRLVTWQENDKKYKDFVKIPIKIINVITGESSEYESIRFASRATGINTSTLRNCLQEAKIFKEIYKLEYVKSLL